MDQIKQPMRFEDLNAWQEARQMTREIYSLTRNSKISRDFGLCDQMQRAGVSTMSNIAEGFERQHVQEKLQFYNVAHSSTAEVRSLSYVIEDNYEGMATEAARVREKALQCGRLLTGLIRSTEGRKRRNLTLVSFLLGALLPLAFYLLPSAFFRF